MIVPNSWETLIIKTQEELNFSSNNNQYKNVPLINAYFLTAKGPKKIPKNSQKILGHIWSPKFRKYNFSKFD